MRALFILAGWLVHGPAAFVVSDSERYLGLATSLAAGSGFTEGGLPELFRTPLYPLLLVPGTLLGQPIAGALIVNMLSIVGVVALVFDMARRTGNAPGMCALIVALEPTLLTWSLKVMAETVLTLCLVAFAACALRALDSERAIWIVSAAAALCAAAYAKPVAYPLIVIVFLAVLPKPGCAAAFALVCVLLLAPWHVRNLRQGNYAGFSTLIDRSLYLAAGASVTARRANVPHAVASQRLRERAKLTDVTNAERYARIRREGTALIASDPIGYAKTHVVGIARTMFDPGAAEYLRLFGLYTEGAQATMESRGFAAIARAQPLWFWSSLALGILLLPLIVLPFVAATRVPRTSRAPFFLFALIAAYLIAAGGGVPARARFRAPAVPFLVLMSAFAFRDRLDSPRWDSSSSAPA